jgi:hypothetical protein
MKMTHTPGAHAPAGAMLHAWSADVFADLGHVPPPDPVLDPVLARGAVTLLTGPRGVGKSWLALAMAEAATGLGLIDIARSPGSATRRTKMKSPATKGGAFAGPRLSRY